MHRSRLAVELGRQTVTSTLMKQLTIASLAELDGLEARIKSSTLRTLTRMRDELLETPDLVALAVDDEEVVHRSMTRRQAGVV